MKQAVKWGALALLGIMGALLVNALFSFLYKAVNHG